MTNIAAQRGSDEQADLLRAELALMRNLKLTVEERLVSLALTAAGTVEADADGWVDADGLCASIGIPIETVRWLFDTLGESRPQRRS